MKRLFLAAALFVVGFSAITANAQSYPDRPVKFLVPYPPGGGNDILARVLAEKLSERMDGQRFFVENVGGAGGNVGTAQAARAAPDGYTLLMANNSFVMNPSLYKSVPFDVTRDFAPIAMVSSIPMVLVVHPAVKANSVAELVALAKAAPDGLTYGTPGTGTPQHLAAEVFASRSGSKLRHVPYRGTGPAVQDILGGQIALMFATAASVEQHVVAGSLRALAITSKQRSPAFPTLPTIAELGYPDYEAGLWYGVMAPAKTPEAVLDKLANAIHAISAEASVAKHLQSLGYEAKPLDRPAFSKVVIDDLGFWRKTISALGLTIDN
ncbi:MAG: tripartite tricarboxylate transporter substrate binding protein [Beijerinckiaceae bacterium]|nr:tripartite tricarboxylate transporter substrate binding protein [Beijerinckiaceae bacterium]